MRKAKSKTSGILKYSTAKDTNGSYAALKARIKKVREDTA